MAYTHRSTRNSMALRKLILTLALLGLAGAQAAVAQTTAFSYQGKLTEGGAPANAMFDFQFTLFDAASGGAPQGATLTREDVQVTSGVFTVQLDFGANVFPGAARFLEIGVRPGASTDAFTLLTPRQPVQATPYAIRSLQAASADNAAQLGGVAAANYLQSVTHDATLSGNGTPGAPLSVAASGWSLTGNAGTNPATNFLGTTDNQPVVFKANGAELLRLSAAGNLGLGTTTPAEKLSVAGNAALTGTLDATGQASKIRFHFDTLADLPSPVTYHGMFAHVHAEGKGYFAHAGVWVPLANEAHTHAAADITSGILGTARGGTGLGAVGAAGTYLRSNGAAWVSSALQAADLPSGSSRYIQNTTTQQAAANFNISGSGTAAGTLSGDTVNAATQFELNGEHALSAKGAANLFAGAGAGAANTAGGSNAFFGANAGEANTTGGFNTLIGKRAGDANTTGGNNTVVGADADVGSANLSFATALGAGAVVSLSNSIVLGRSGGQDTVHVPGEMSVSGTLNASGAGLVNLNANNFSTGTLAVARGGTGLTAAGAAGNYLRSNGAAWVSTALQAADIPTGSGNYIQNTTSPQAASNFNISGNGTAGGTLGGNIVNATTQYNLGGSRILSNAGTDNLFAGGGAGAANTTGSQNTFAGQAAGDDNTTGSFNTLLGESANVLAGNLTNATAIGSKAAVNASNSLVLGQYSGNGTGASEDTKVGIGTNAPNALLEIVDNNLASGAALLLTGHSNLGATALAFRTSGGTRAAPSPTASDNALAAISADGHTGTGFTNSKAAIIAHATQNFSATANGTRWVFSTTANNTTNPLERVRIDQDGQVGIGTAAPDDLLDVNGDIRVGTSGTNGCLNNNNGGAIVGTCASDLRFKRELTPFGQVLNQLTRLQPKHFFWRAAEFPDKGFGTEREAGLIAQEVEQVLPELVTTDERGFKAVNYSKLPLLSLQAIKELKAENEALQARLADLERLVRARQAPRKQSTAPKRVQIKVP